jgi:hypothetical protein
VVPRVSPPVPGRCWCSGCRSLEDLDRAAKGLASALPGVKEREAWSKTTFRVAGRLVLTLAPDGISATMKASLDDQAALVATVGTFAATAHLGRYGWVTVRVDRGGPDELEYLVVDAWRQCAPQRLAPVGRTSYGVAADRSTFRAGHSRMARPVKIPAKVPYPGQLGIGPRFGGMIGEIRSGEVDQGTAYAFPMRAHARPPRRTTSTCRPPRNRSSPATSRRAHPAYACVRRIDKAPRKTPEKPGPSAQT